MKSLSRFVITLFACAALASIATAGPEPMAPSYKESKEVIPPAPPPCDWSGVYFGLHIGGQFGHSEDVDEEYNTESSGTGLPSGASSSDDDRPWGYHESGVVVGGQIGYNFQFRHFVFGLESDIGYMNLDGSGVEPGSPGGDTRGESDSDFYMTFRGRLGYALDWQGCWLLYATAGAIGVNYDVRVVDDCITGDCESGIVDGSKEEIVWGYTLGGGIERQIGKHWSIKFEYLYFALDDQSFTAHGESLLSTTSSASRAGGQPNFQEQKDPTFTVPFSGAETHGHILRGGLNFHF